MRNESFISTGAVRNVLAATTILACMSLSSTAAGQAPPPNAPPGNPAASPDQRPGLGGPQVDPGAADSEKGFDGGKQGGRKGRAESGAMMDERMKGAAWMRTYESIKQTLSAETRAKTDAIKSAFDASMKTWNDANAEKMKALRQQMKDQQNEKDGKAAADQLKTLRDTMPKMEETQKQIFALLSETEQAAFKKKLESNEKQMRSLRARDGNSEQAPGPGGKGKGAKGGKGKDGPGDPNGMPADGTPPAGGGDKAPPPPPFDP